MEDVLKLKACTSSITEVWGWGTLEAALPTGVLDMRLGPEGADSQGDRSVLLLLRGREEKTGLVHFRFPTYF